MTALSSVRTPAWATTVLADRRVSSTPRGPAHETTRRLIAGSLGGLLILVVAGYFIGSQLAERQVLTDARRFSALLANGVVGPRLTPDLIAGDPRAVAELDGVVRGRLMPRTSLRRVKVWSADGRILYSDERREIGHVFALTGAQRQLLRTGGSVAEVSDLSRGEDVLERRLEPRLVETYTAVRSDSGQRLLFETYMSYAQIREQREAVFTMLSLLAAAGIVLFAGFQVALGRINLRWVRRQQAALDERSKVVSDRARQRLARDLHDGPVQDLVGASYLVDGALQSMRSGQVPQAEQLLVGATESVRGSISSLRSVMVDVYPRTLHDRGLRAALDDLAQSLRARGLDVEVAVLGEENLSSATGEALYRAAQEAVRNVLHHAHATAVRILVDATPLQGDYAVLRVIDNGVGMPPGISESPDGHLGLSSLMDIAEERRGYLQTSSAPGEGTQLTMELPL
jgi:two-component system, NarL family, sensor kinase